MKKTWQEASKLYRKCKDANLPGLRGTNNFDDKFAVTFSEQVNHIKAQRPTCEGNQQLTNYQQGAVLACTVLDRLLIVHATGSGKTKTMHAMLDNKLGDIRPKVVLVPHESIMSNFYKDIEDGQTNLGKYAKLHKNGSTADTLEVKGPLLRSYREAVKKYVDSNGTTTSNLGYNSPLRAYTFNDAYHWTKIDGQPQSAVRAMAVNEACFLAPPDKDTIFKDYYGLTAKDQQVEGSLRRNPFNNKIIVVDEAHKLLEDTLQNSILLEALRTSRNSQIYFFTATPIDENTTPSAINPLLAVVKNKSFLSYDQQHVVANQTSIEDQTGQNNQGYVSFYYNFDEPFYPRTIPYLNVLHAPPDVPLSTLVVARIVFTELYGENLKNYKEAHRAFEHNTKSKADAARKATSFYSDRGAYHMPSYMHSDVVKFYRVFNKFDCLVRHLTDRSLKTIVLFTTDGAAAFQKFLQAVHKDKMFTPSPTSLSRHVASNTTTSTTSTTSTFKIGFLRNEDDKNVVLPAFNDASNLTGSKLAVLCITKAFGTGVDFHAVRRIILTGPPESASTYFQNIGRGLRLCKHYGLPHSERTLEVEMLVATFDDNRVLDDLEQHQLDDNNNNLANLTVDEIMLIQLRHDIQTHRAKMAEFSKDAIDRTWYNSEWASQSGGHTSDELYTVCLKRDESDPTDSLAGVVAAPDRVLPSDAQTTNYVAPPTSNTYPSTNNNTNNYNNNKYDANTNNSNNYVDLHKEYQRPKPAEIQITTKKTIRTDEEELSLARTAFGDIAVKLVASSAPTDALLRDELLIDLALPVVFIHNDIDAARNQIGMEASGLTMISVINDFPKLIDEAATLSARQQRDEELRLQRAEQARLEEVERQQKARLDDLERQRKELEARQVERTKAQAKPDFKALPSVPSAGKVGPQSVQQATKSGMNNVDPQSVQQATKSGINNVAPQSVQQATKSGINNVDPQSGRQHDAIPKDAKSGPLSVNNKVRTTNATNILRAGYVWKQKKSANQTKKSQQVRQRMMQRMIRGGARNEATKPKKQVGATNKDNQVVLAPIEVFYFDDTATRFVTASLVHKLTRIVANNMRVVDYYNRNFVGTNMAKWDRIVGLHIHYLPFANKVYLVWQPNVHMVRPVMYVNREALLKSFGERVDAMRAAQLYESIVEYRGPLERTLWSEGLPLLEGDQSYVISTEVRVPDLLDSETLQTVPVSLVLKNELAKQAVLDVYKELLARSFSTDVVAVHFVEARSPDKLVFKTSDVPGMLLQQNYEDFVNPILLSPPSNIGIPYGHRTLFFKAFSYIPDVNQFVRHNLGSQIARIGTNSVGLALSPPLRSHVTSNSWILIHSDVKIFPTVLLNDNLASSTSSTSYYANDPAYIKAKQDQKVGVILRESNTSFITTVLPYKSVLDFARSSSDDAWNEFWYFCLDTKQRAEEANNTQVWMYTEAVPTKGFRVLFSRTDPTPKVDAQVAQEQVRLMQQQQVAQQQHVVQQQLLQQQLLQQQLAQQQLLQQQVALQEAEQRRQMSGLVGVYRDNIRQKLSFLVCKTASGIDAFEFKGRKNVDAIIKARSVFPQESNKTWVVRSIPVGDSMLFVADIQSYSLTDTQDRTVVSLEELKQATKKKDSLLDRLCANTNAMYQLQSL